MARQYKNYTDDDIIRESKNVTSLSGLLKSLNLVVAGGNFANMKRKLQRLDVDTSHWTGQAWNKDQQLKNWSDYTRPRHLKKHVIKDRGHECEMCNNTTWMDSLIPLEIHHIDGDRTNNELINLQLLCCNCHATTDNWRGKNNK